jgi:hypothetical protein
LEGAKFTAKVVDSDVKKTSQNTKNADKSEANLNPKKSDAEVLLLKLTLIYWFSHDSICVSGCRLMWLDFENCIYALCFYILDFHLCKILAF